MTEQARTWVLEDEPGKAYRWIADGLGGSDEAIAAALGVVTGKRRLVGDSSDEDGLELVDEDPSAPAVIEYLAQVEYLYAGRIRRDGRWVRPSGSVEAFGYADAKHANFECVDKSVFAEKRAQYYAPEGGVALRAEVPASEGAPGGTRWVVFESCPEPPQWLRPAATLDEAVAQAIRAGRPWATYGPDPEQTERPRYTAAAIITDSDMSAAEAEQLEDAALELEYAEFKARCARYGELVRAQAAPIERDLCETKALGFFPLELLAGRTVQVPLAPFTHWALRFLGDELDQDDLPTWAPVSPSGIKMPCDNPYHTDWVLGAGLDPDDCYGSGSENINDPAHEAAMLLQERYLEGKGL